MLPGLSEHSVSHSADSSAHCRLVHADQFSTDVLKCWRGQVAQSDEHLLQGSEGESAIRESDVSWHLTCQFQDVLPTKSELTKHFSVVVRVEGISTVPEKPVSSQKTPLSCLEKQKCRHIYTRLGPLSDPQRCDNFKRENPYRIVNQIDVHIDFSRLSTRIGDKRG